MNIFIDIETLPTEDAKQIAYVSENLKAPANYKKQESIQRWIEDNTDDMVKKTALSGLFGRVYMIGLAGDRGPVTVFRGGSEIDILSRLATHLKIYGANKYTFIGHNAKDFDLPFLSQRMMVNGLGPLWPHQVRPPVEDTMEMFACGRYKQYYALDALCMAFGIPTPKSELDGSKVHEYYLAGRHDEVAEYCAKDVESMRAVYHAMQVQKVAT